MTSADTLYNLILNSYSEGGYDSIAAADGFSKHGIKPVQVLAGGSTIKMRSWMPLGFMRTYAAGKLNAFAQINVALVGLGMSNTTPGVANYNTCQTFLNPAFIDTVLKMVTDLGAPSTLNPSAYFGYLQQNQNHSAFFTVPFVISDDLTQFFANALLEEDFDPCVNNSTGAIALNVDKICEALDDNDLTDIVLNADYAIELCHSSEDELVAFENVPDASLLKYEVIGSHAAASFPCSAKLFAGTTLKKPEIRRPEWSKSSKSKKTKTHKTRRPEWSKSSKSKKTKTPKRSI